MQNVRYRCSCYLLCEPANVRIGLYSHLQRRVVHQLALPITAKMASTQTSITKSESGK